MRLVPVVAFFALAGVSLAGCSDGTTAEPDADSGFEDLGAQASSTTGVILGVVVDDAIRPVKDVAVGLKLPGGEDKATASDVEGRFAFSNLQPGTYFLSTRHPQFSAAQTSVEVVAGVSDPPVLRVQITRLFSQDPYSVLTKFDGYLSCAYSLGLSSTCVNDYTRVTGEQCTPAGCYCAGGCLRDYNLSSAGGNVREYVSSVDPGWQVLVIEETWEPTSDAGTALGFTVSYFSRPNAGHWFGSVNGENPLRIQFDVGEEHASASYGGEEPPMIPPEGYDELFVFFGAGDGSVVLSQGFQSFQTSFYYGIPPDGWSFVAGDELPF